MIYMLIIVWVLGAAITLKADAMISNNPTNWREDWWLALLFWWLVAILICTDRHAVYTEGWYDKRTYHY